MSLSSPTITRIEDILAKYIILRKYKKFWPRTIDRKDTSNSVNLYQVLHTDRNILAERYSTLTYNSCRNTLVENDLRNYWPKVLNDSYSLNKFPSLKTFESVLNFLAVCVTLETVLKLLEVCVTLETVLKCASRASEASRASPAKPNTHPPAPSKIVR